MLSARYRVAKHGVSERDTMLCDSFGGGEQKANLRADANTICFVTLHRIGRYSEHFPLDSQDRYAFDSPILWLLC